MSYFYTTEKKSLWNEKSLNHHENRRTITAINYRIMQVINITFPQTVLNTTTGTNFSSFQMNSLKMSKINAPNLPAAFMNNTQSIDPVGEWTLYSGITIEIRFFPNCFNVFVERTNANKCTFLAYIPDTENAFHSRMDFSSWNLFYCFDNVLCFGCVLWKCHRTGNSTSIIPFNMWIIRVNKYELINSKSLCRKLNM